jgi:hypothetical protein
MSCLHTIAKASLSSVGVICLLFSIGIVASFPSQKAKAVKLKSALQQADLILHQRRNASIESSLETTIRFKADIGYQKEEEIQVSVLQWRPVDLSKAGSFSGGTHTTGPPNDYLLCYWRGESFELLDSKSGKTSLDHQISFNDYLPFLTVFAGLACVSFWLRSLIPKPGHTAIPELLVQPR